jgi:hypothetical protein
MRPVEIKRETHPMLWDCLDNITLANGDNSQKRYWLNGKWWSWLTRFESDLEKLEDNDLNTFSTGIKAERDRVTREHNLYNLRKMIDEFSNGDE